MKTKDLIKYEKILVKMFNKHYINIAEETIPNKATGPDHIRLKIIKTIVNVIDSHLAYIINKNLKENKCSENAKTV